MLLHELSAITDYEPLHLGVSPHFLVVWPVYSVAINRVPTIRESQGVIRFLDSQAICPVF